METPTIQDGSRDFVISPETPPSIAKKLPKASDQIGVGVLHGPNFDIVVEIGVEALIRCYDIHGIDVSVWAGAEFDKGRAGQARILCEMQKDSSYSIKEILENWFMDSEAYASMDFQKRLLKVFCEITGAKYKELLASLEPDEPATQKKPQADQA